MSVPREVLLNRKRYKDWIHHYKPTMVSTGSSEYVERLEVTEENRKKLEAVDEHLLWSEVESDDGSMLINGFWHHDEVLYWILAEQAWSGSPGFFSIEMAVRVWCKSCDSSGKTGAGDSCDKCDGDGYKIYDVD